MSRVTSQCEDKSYEGDEEHNFFEGDSTQVEKYNVLFGRLHDFCIRIIFRRISS